MIGTNAPIDFLDENEKNTFENEKDTIHILSFVTFCLENLNG